MINIEGLSLSKPNKLNNVLQNNELNNVLQNNEFNNVLQNNKLNNVLQNNKLNNVLQNRLCKEEPRMSRSNLFLSLITSGMKEFLKYSDLQETILKELI